MYRDEQVSLVSVSNVGTGMKGDENVLLARVNNLDIGAVALYEHAEAKRYVQVDMLLLCQFSYGASIVAAMASVDDEDEFLLLCIRYMACRRAESHD